jgi:hypothetical protein
MLMPIRAVKNSQFELLQVFEWLAFAHPATGPVTDTTTAVREATRRQGDAPSELSEESALRVKHSSIWPCIVDTFVISENLEIFM